MVAFCVAVVIGVGWFKTGGISWREGIREPSLVPFWLGLFWPMSDWWRRLAGARRLLPVVAFGFVLAVLCWLYPTRIDQIVIMSVTYAVVEYFMGRARTRGRRQGDQTRLGL